MANKLEEAVKSRKKNEMIKAEDMEFNNQIYTKETEIGEYLKEKTIELYTIQAKGSLALGKVFSEVYDKLISKRGLYEAWIAENNFNKRTALRHRKRYSLYKIAPTDRARSIVAVLPVNAIELADKIEDEKLLSDYLEIAKDKKDFIEEIEKIVNDTDKTIKLLPKEKVFDFNLDLIEKTSWISKKISHINNSSLSEDKKEKVFKYIIALEKILNEV